MQTLDTQLLDLITTETLRRIQTQLIGANPEMVECFNHYCAIQSAAMHAKARGKSLTAWSAIFKCKRLFHPKGYTLEVQEMFAKWFTRISEKVMLEAEFEAWRAGLSKTRA
jgi:hypothetical protein